MSKDFAIRSIEISDESQGKGFCKPEIQDRQRLVYCGAHKFVLDKVCHWKFCVIFGKF